MQLPLSPLLHHTPPHTPLIPKTPQTPYIPIAEVPSLVGTHIYLCSLTFSLRPEEAASVGKQQKLVFKNVIHMFCFSTQEISYYGYKQS